MRFKGADRSNPRHPQEEGFHRPRRSKPTGTVSGRNGYSKRMDRVKTYRVELLPNGNGSNDWLVLYQSEDKDGARALYEALKVVADTSHHQVRLVAELASTATIVGFQAIG